MLLAFGAIGTACAANEAGGTPGRVGIAPPVPTLPEVEDPPSDATLLRTLQSMEYAALELYKALVAKNVLTAEEQPVFDRIVQDHTRHADEVGQLITGAGAQPYPCPNEFMMDRSVNPVLAAIEGTEFLQTVTLLASYRRHLRDGPKRAVSVKRWVRPTERSSDSTAVNAAARTAVSRGAERARPADRFIDEATDENARTEGNNADSLA